MKTTSSEIKIKKLLLAHKGFEPMTLRSVAKYSANAASLVIGQRRPWVQCVLWARRLMLGPQLFQSYATVLW